MTAYQQRELIIKVAKEKSIPICDASKILLRMQEEEPEIYAQALKTIPERPKGR